MNGHQQLLAMRRSGHKPACVWIVDDDSEVGRMQASTWHHSPNDFAGKFYAHVQLDESDMPLALDFRFVVGLPVYVECGRSHDRSKRLVEALANAKPSLLLAVIGDELVVKHG